MALNPAPSASATPLRVLIVEDESLVALDLEERLAGLGYEISGVVDNCADALHHIQTNIVDMVLMDIHIKGDTDGIQTAAALRSSSYLPVIFLTAHADETTLARAGLTEPFGYVLKPFDERELRATMQMAHYRHQAETRLRKMEQWLATTLRSIGDGVIATDATGRITFMNAMAEALTGWTRGTAVGRELAQVFAITTGEGPDETNGLLSRALTEGITITLEEGRFLRSRDGRLTPVNDSLAPIRSDNGTISGCVVIFRDNTANVTAEIERRRLEQKMQEAQRLESLGVMAGGIAHDFNNLLVAVTCNASLGRLQVTGNPLLSDCFSEIERAGQRAAQLCQQMLAYAGKSQLQLKEVELSAFTRSTSELLQIGLNKNTILNYDLAEGLPPFLADRSQLQQVVMNLVINGSEALEGRPGTISIRTSLLEADADFLSRCRLDTALEPGPYLLLEVTDTGHGMKPEVLNHIFDPFFTTKFNGRGLGLAAMLGIVRSHGGTLAVDSRSGEGTTFQILFPPVENPSPPAPGPAASNLAWRGTGSVLLIDDEFSIRIVGNAVLRHLGFHVESAEDGLEGLNKALSPNADYQAILLDLTMPKLDGAAVLQAIRAQRPRQPILLMSGYSSQEVEELMHGDPFVDFLQKPFTLEDMSAKLERLLAIS